MILFLDVDGVLNTYTSREYFVEYNMNCLKMLAKSLDFKIVLSSDWRRNLKNLAEVRSELQFIGLDIFDCTIVKLSLYFRKDEIGHWLSTNEWSKAVIIDDMSPNFCDPKIDGVLFHQTDDSLGLTEEDVDIILKKVR